MILSMLVKRSRLLNNVQLSEIQPKTITCAAVAKDTQSVEKESAMKACNYYKVC